eukprot:COSAG06_NODE_54664_length_293_cov_1.051546_1_plen_41_part_01
MHCSAHSRLRSDEYQVCCLQRQARSSRATVVRRAAAQWLRA